jgi:rSAM/selenodomain-associated transferase 2
MVQQSRLHNSLSVIIPVGRGDTAWEGLLRDLEHLDDQDEVVFVSDEPSLLKISEAQKVRRFRTKMIASEMGRARQLNTGAAAASHDSLWFVHSDSRLDVSAIQKVRDALSNQEREAVYFLRLKFQGDGPLWMKLNELGVRIRAELLKIPFGDQGLAMHRATFNRLGGFSEQAPYGEDHLLIWKAHQLRVHVECVAATIQTSARKYLHGGWLATTMRHVHMTFLQGLPEFLTMLRQRGGSPR